VNRASLCRASCSATTVALERGGDVDKPRNPAKSVTVESGKY